MGLFSLPALRDFGPPAGSSSDNQASQPNPLTPETSQPKGDEQGALTIPHQPAANGPVAEPGTMFVRHSGDTQNAGDDYIQPTPGTQVNPQPQNEIKITKK